MIKINGKIIETNGLKNVTIINGKVIANGKEYITDEDSKTVNIIIEGNVGKLDCDSSVVVNGDVEGKISCGGSLEVGGDVDGNVNCGGSCEIGGNQCGALNCGGSIEINGKRI